MKKIQQFVVYFLATMVLVLLISNTAWFNALANKEWFKTMSSAYSLLGVGFKDVIIFLFLINSSLKGVLEGNLPYLCLVFSTKFRLRYKYNLSHMSRIDFFIVSWYLYAVEKKLIKMSLANPGFVITHPSFILLNPTDRCDSSIIRAVFFDPLYLLRLVSIKDLNRRVRLELTSSLTDYLYTSVDSENVFIILCSIVSNFNVYHGSESLRRLWRYSVTTNTSLSIHKNTTLINYSLNGQIEVNDDEYLDTVTSFERYLNYSDAERFRSIFENIDNKLNNCHKLQIIELKFIR